MLLQIGLFALFSDRPVPQDSFCRKHARKQWPAKCKDKGWQSNSRVTHLIHTLLSASEPSMTVITRRLSGQPSAGQLWSLFLNQWTSIMGAVKTLLAGLRRISVWVKLSEQVREVACHNVTTGHAHNADYAIIYGIIGGWSVKPGGDGHCSASHWPAGAQVNNGIIPV